MMTNLILGIIVIAAMLYGLRLMDHLDQFMSHEKKWKKEKVKKDKYAIVFGKSGFEEKVGTWFEKSGVKAVYLESIYIDKSWEQVSFLAAVSDSDVDNLSVCNLFSKMYPNARIFSLCNEENNWKLFKQAHCRVFKTKEELLQQVELLTMENEVGAA